jgi:hypothetical protein
MKTASVFFAIFLIITGCEKVQVNSDYSENIRENVGSDVLLKIGRRGDEFRFNDIELYDSSTHIIYFKKEHKEFTQLSVVLQGSFYFLDSGQTIYSGTLLPAYSNSIPEGPIIQTPSMYGDHALRIDSWWDDKPDVRNSPALIRILKDHNLLHSGLSGSVDYADVSSDQISFGFTVENHDLTDLLIIDVNKTGPNLFHYFTNGLYLRDKDRNEVFSSTIAFQQPDPWNSWKSEWLSVLKSGERMSFAISYPLAMPMTPGEYNLSFEFPGLGYQVSKTDLFQGNSRIWLGDITLKGKVTIQ